MKIYVAGKYELKDEALLAMEMVREAGHTITHVWCDEDDTLYAEDTGARNEYHKVCALKDYHGVIEADALILIAHERGYGLMVELGIALVCRIPIYVVNAECRDTVFWRMPTVKHVMSVQSALDELAA